MRTCCLLAVGVLVGCGDGGGSDAGSDVSDVLDVGGDGDVVEDGAPDPTEDVPVDVVEDEGPGPLLVDVSFVRAGSPEGGYRVITDLVVFLDRLYLTTSVSPLGDWGARVFWTPDGSTFTRVLDDSTSQGYLRMRVFDDFLYVPDGDPNGYDPSYVYISSDGDAFVRSTVIGSVHTFDVIKYMDDLLASNGMMSGAGSLCRTPDNGASPWTEVESTSFSRLKFMAIVNGRLLVGKRVIGSPADYVLWNGDVDSTSGVGTDAVPGEANTWRWYTTSRGRLFWSLGASSTLMVMYTDDGETWTQVHDLNGEFVSDLAELDGNLYALGHSGLWGSTDHSTFVLVGAAPGSDTFGPLAVSGGYSAEATASMETFQGSLWAGSSNDGWLYRIE
jgi:hypothetical protein